MLLWSLAFLFVVFDSVKPMCLPETEINCTACIPLLLKVILDHEQKWRHLYGRYQNLADGDPPPGT